jgi:hypothetical protein
MKKPTKLRGKAARAPDHDANAGSSLFAAVVVGLSEALQSNLAEWSEICEVRGSPLARPSP